MNTPAVSYNKTGGMVGAGVEYAFTNNWSGKVEYDFMDFGTDRAAYIDVFFDNLDYGVVDGWVEAYGIKP